MVQDKYKVHEMVRQRPNFQSTAAKLGKKSTWLRQHTRIPALNSHIGCNCTQTLPCGLYNKPQQLAHAHLSLDLHGGIRSWDSACSEFVNSKWIVEHSQQWINFDLTITSTHIRCGALTRQGLWPIFGYHAHRKHKVRIIAGTHHLQVALVTSNALSHASHNVTPN